MVFSDETFYTTYSSLNCEQDTIITVLFTIPKKHLHVTIMAIGLETSLIMEHHMEPCLAKMFLLADQVNENDSGGKLGTGLSSSGVYDHASKLSHQ